MVYDRKQIMLAFSNRFHGHGSLRYVYKNGVAKRSHIFTIKTVRNTHRKSSRFAVVISKKVHKSAVGRNRVRRRLYEIIRHEMARMELVHDVAIIVSSAEVLSLPSEELKKELVRLFDEAGLYVRP